MTILFRSVRPEARSGARRGPKAFTLIELLVAVGAIAVIAVAIAAVFETVGRTVSGGKRVSRLMQYAAIVENQMRRDFASMTRDGVLVIRNEYAEDADLVKSHADDNHPRARRIDEILFFARRDSSSARAPVAPGMTPASGEAMVYYGQGLRLNPLSGDSGELASFRLPQVDDGSLATPYPSERALGFNDPDNPNRYASEWSVLRMVTLLAPPGSTQFVVPPASVLTELGLTPARLADREVQVAGQPAAATAFRSLNTVFPTNLRAVGPVVRQEDNGLLPRRPALASGLVDIATTDLAEIRRIITDAADYPVNISNETDLFDPANPGAGLLNGTFVRSPNYRNGDLRYMHAWMQDLLPADSANAQRVRYEPSMPDLLGVLAAYQGAAPDEAFRLADQNMVGSSVFVPRCTEFIVEYSFGQTVTDDTLPQYGELIWHGLRRYVDLNQDPAQNDGPFQDGREYLVADRYPVAAGAGNVLGFLDEEVRDADGATRLHRLAPWVVYGQQIQDGSETELVSHFGYIDPSYSPASSLEPETIPMAWPRLIRVTMTLADPGDPSIEETFQFVFETPEGEEF